MNVIQRIRHWTMRLPSTWGLGQADIHSSLLLTMSLLSTMLLLLSFSRPGFYELHTVAISLPVVWTLSLAVRIAAQQLSVGGYSHDMLTVVGPTGNLSTDYEYLPVGRIFAYAVAGQLATGGLVLLGLTVNAAMLPMDNGQVRLDQLLDFMSGWSSQAWATQIMWVNLFIGAVNFLPTVPFDLRAAAFAFFSKRNRNAQEPAVFRWIASLDSHLAALLVGVACSAAVLSLVTHREVVAWYAAAAAAVYLFVASRWERSRAEDLEEQYAPIATRSLQVKLVDAKVPRLSRDHQPDPVEKLAEAAERSAEELFDESPDSDSVSHVDIDEILRKLHREGPDSLLPVEQEALLTASRELKQKRGGG